MNKFLERLRSMKLAIGLIAYLAIMGVLATLVPQGQEEAYYRGAYPRLLAELVLQSGMTRFFTSLLFLVPAFLFFANLSACAAHRFLGQLKRAPGKRRHGPDLLHLGLVLLVLGAVLSFSLRQEGSVVLAPGEGVEFPDGRLLKLRSFEYLTYEDGRPKEWTSLVDVTKDGKAEIEAFPVRVNHPLRVGGITVYQVSHYRDRVLAFRDMEGREHFVKEGEEAEAAGWKVFFMAVAPGGAPAAGGPAGAAGPSGAGAGGGAAGDFVLRLTPAAGEPSVVRAGPGGAAGPFAVDALRDIDLTGLQAVSDPGYLAVLVAMILVALGTAWTFIQKLGDIEA